MPLRSRFSSNEEYNAWYREYRNKNRGKIRLYNQKYNSDWRKKNGYHSENSWRLRFPEKVKAQQALNRAVRNGKLIKKPCFICDSSKSVAHHSDYNKPLQVIWVCRIHHRSIHYTYNPPGTFTNKYIKVGKVKHSIEYKVTSVEKLIHHYKKLSI